MMNQCVIMMNNAYVESMIMVIWYKRKFSNRATWQRLGSLVVSDFFYLFKKTIT